jgi:hypothetical protein
VLEIFWPKTGLTQIFRDLAVDQALEITEGQARAKRISLVLARNPSESSSPRASLCAAPSADSLDVGLGASRVLKRTPSVGYRSFRT